MRWQRLIYPHVPVRALPQILLLALYGCLLAGAYGIIHDQITYTLAPEYYTHFKFDQFDYADLGLGDRVFAGTVGFLATFWIGTLAGWILGRVSLKPGSETPQMRLVIVSLLTMLGVSALSGAIGYVYGTLTWQTAEVRWAEWREAYGLSDLPAFARVGYIHNMGYIGGVVGGIIAGVLMKRNSETQ